MPNLSRQQLGHILLNLPSEQRNQKVIDLVKQGYQIEGLKTNVSPIKSLAATPILETGNFLTGLGENVEKRIGDVKETFSQTAAGKINPFSTGLQTVGVAAGLAGDVFGQGVKAIAKTILPQQAQQTLKRGVQAVGGSQPIQSLVQNYNFWKSAHPEAAKDFESFIDIASLFPLGKSAELAETGIKTGAEEFGTRVISPLKSSLEEATAKKSFQDALNIIKPELTKSEKIESLRAGRGTTGGLLKEATIRPSSRDEDVARSVIGIVDKNKNIFQNISSVKQEIGKEASKTRNYLLSNDAIFSSGEFKNHLEAVEKPIMIASDQTLNKAFNKTRSTLIRLVDERPKKLSNVLDARQKFDNFVDQEFPNLYTSDQLTPMKKAILDMRKAANNFVSVRLPEGDVFKKSLRKQNLMFDAIDNMSVKAVKQVGNTGFQRLMERFPTTTKIIKGIGIGGGAVIGAKEATRFLRGQ